MDIRDMCLISTEVQKPSMTEPPDRVAIKVELMLYVKFPSTVNDLEEFSLFENALKVRLLRKGQKR